MQLYAPDLSKQEVNELRHLGVKLEEPAPEVDPEFVTRAIMTEVARKLPFLFGGTAPRSRPMRLTKKATCHSIT
jgi:hypothetical protein